MYREKLVMHVRKKGIGFRLKSWIRAFLDELFSTIKKKKGRLSNKQKEKEIVKEKKNYQ